jgi:hypothetical protein
VGSEYSVYAVGGVCVVCIKLHSHYTTHIPQRMAEYPTTKQQGLSKVRVRVLIDVYYHEHNLHTFHIHSYTHYTHYTHTHILSLSFVHAQFWIKQDVWCRNFMVSTSKYINPGWNFDQKILDEVRRG